MSETIRVLKRNLDGDVMWQYTGRILRRESNAVVLEAFFDRPDFPFMDVVLKKDDRFIETFYTDRWYNIFEIHDRDNGKIKGWYCNIGRPAAMAPGEISYVDLALDLWVAADGKQTILDRDEFEALSLSKEERRQALSALKELQALFRSRRLDDKQRDTK